MRQQPGINSGAWVAGSLISSARCTRAHAHAHVDQAVGTADGDGGLGASTWILGAGVAFTAFATAFIVRLADQALKDELDDDDADAMP